MHSYLVENLRRSPEIAELTTGDVLSDGAEVWEFQIGNLNTSPPLVREIARGDNAFTIALRRAGDAPGFALHSGTFKVHHSYRRTLDGALRVAASWPAKLLRLRAQGVLPESRYDERSVSDPSQRDATIVESLRCKARMARRWAATAFEYVFVGSVWNVGVAESPVSTTPDLSSVRWMPSDPAYFIADPMIVDRGDHSDVFFEFFPYSTATGTIAHISPNGTVSKPQTVISGPRHLSYPFILEHDGDVYCIPEDSGSREVALYRARRYPEEWEKAATLIEGVPALDTTIFQRDGLWWLFLTRADDEPNANLLIWYADELFGPWHEHAANPVKNDITGARPAGNLFFFEGELYRPAQDCSERYGGALTLHRIVELTPERFREERVRRIEPVAPYRDGLHTLSSSGRHLAIDGRRDYINLRKPLWLLRRRLGA
jgi:hypothetical protein